MIQIKNIALRLVIYIALSGSLVFSGCLGGGAKPSPKHLSAGSVQSNKGMSMLNHGCNKKALEYFMRALELYTAAGQTNGVAESLNNLGAAYRAINEYKSAKAFFLEAATLYKNEDNLKGLRQTLTNLAALEVRRGNLKKAQKILDKAKAIKINNETSPFIPILINQAVIYIKTEDYPKAENFLYRAFLKADQNNSAQMSALYFSLGSLWLETSEYKKAVASFEKAFKADQKTGFYAGMAEDLFMLGNSWSKAGKPEKAIQFWKQAVGIYALLENQEKCSNIMEKLENAAEKSGISLEVTRLFVEQWLKGLAITAPCK